MRQSHSNFVCIHNLRKIKRQLSYSQKIKGLRFVNVPKMFVSLYIIIHIILTHEFASKYYQRHHAFQSTRHLKAIHVGDFTLYFHYYILPYFIAFTLYIIFLNLIITIPTTYDTPI